VFRARGREHRRLRPGRHLRAVQHEPPQLLAEVGAARLAREDDVASKYPQVLFEQPRLGRLPRPVDPFEGHEHDAV